MTNLPHLLIEGMIIAGLVTGEARHPLYPARYHLQEEILGEEIRRCYRSGFWEKKSCSDLDYELEVFVSPRGTSAEKKAADRSHRSHRAEPRNKPPFPGQIGLWQKPTVINNVETFIMSRKFSLAGLIGLSRKAPVITWVEICWSQRHVAARESSKLPWACPCAMSFSIMLVAFAAAVSSKLLRRRPSSGYLPAP